MNVDKSFHGAPTHPVIDLWNSPTAGAEVTGRLSSGRRRRQRGCSKLEYQLTVSHEDSRWMSSWWPESGGAMSMVEEGKRNSQESDCCPTSEPHQYSMRWQDHIARTIGALEWSQWLIPPEPGDGWIPHVTDQLEGGWDPHCTWHVFSRGVSPLSTELDKWSWLLWSGDWAGGRGCWRWNSWLTQSRGEHGLEHRLWRQ